MIRKASPGRDQRRVQWSGYSKLESGDDGVAVVQHQRQPRQTFLHTGNKADRLKEDSMTHGSRGVQKRTRGPLVRL
jgi:hypothetical protein